MIISRTPYRISFFGGGTDFPSYYEKFDNSGVISTSINKYCYITARILPKFFTHKHRITYSQVELINEISEISHPVIRQALQFLNISDGLEIHHDGDVPAWSGLGTSSSFTVGLLLTLKTLLKEKVSKNELAKDAIYLEQKLLKEWVGSQDQVAVSYGGFNSIKFLPTGNFSVTKMKMSENNKINLEKHLLLVYSGIKRLSDSIEKDKVINIKHNYAHLDNIAKIRDQALSNFESDNICFKSLGELMTESWMNKKSLSDKVSNPIIDEIISISMNNGAYGAKVLGAGGGGFVLVLANPSIHKILFEKLRKFILLNILFDNDGTKIIFESEDD